MSTDREIAALTPPPEPGRPRSVYEFVEALRLLRQWAGGTSYRELARRISVARGGDAVSHNTVADLFRSGRQWLDLDLIGGLVRALGLDAHQAARWRDACVAAHSSAERSGSTEVLRQLPDELPMFVGRQAELGQVLSWAEADRRSASGPTVISVEGMAGIGKTQFAIRAAHQLVHTGLFGDAQLYANLRGFDGNRPPLAPAEILDSFLHRLGVSGSRIPVDLDGKAATYRDRLAEREALILLDNAQDEDQVRELIPSSPKCLVIVTSRRSLAGLPNVRQLAQSVFDPDEAVALMRRVVGDERVDAGLAEAEKILRVCGRLPIAVALAAQRLRTRTAWTMSDLAHYLTAQGLDGFTAGGSRLKPLFQLSYRDLDAERQRHYRLLALHPGNAITPGTAGALIGVDAVSAQRSLEGLLDQNLLQQTVPGVYEFHDLLRAYVGGIAREQESAADRDAALARLLEHNVEISERAIGILHPQHSGADREESEDSARFFPCASAQDWLDVERPNLVLAARAAVRGGHPEHVVALARILAPHLQAGGYFAQDELLQELAIEAADDARDSKGKCEALLNLGSTLAWTGRYAKAIDCLGQAEAGFRALAEHRKHAEVLSVIGRTHDMSSHPLRGLHYYRLALDSFTTLGDTAGTGRVMANLGFAHERLGRYREALMWAEQALEFLSAAHARTSVGRALTNIGRAHAWLGDSARAFDALHRAIADCRNNGDRVGEGAGLNALAFTYERANRPEEALDILNDAAALFADTGNWMDECRTMINTGRCFLATGDADRSVEILQQALEISQELDDRILQSEVLNSLGGAHLSVGREQLAFKYHNRALELAELSSHRYNRARALLGIGDFLRITGDAVNARSTLETSRSAFAEMELPEAAQVEKLLRCLD